MNLPWRKKQTKPVTAPATELPTAEKGPFPSLPQGSYRTPAPGPEPEPKYVNDQAECFRLIRDGKLRVWPGYKTWDVLVRYETQGQKQEAEFCDKDLGKAIRKAYAQWELWIHCARS